MKPLSWLLGHWKAVDGICQYPTFTKTLKYCEDLRIEHAGQPYITLKYVTKNLLVYLTFNLSLFIFTVQLALAMKNNFLYTVKWVL